MWSAADEVRLAEKTARVMQADREMAEAVMARYRGLAEQMIDDTYAPPAAGDTGLGPTS